MLTFTTTSGDLTMTGIVYTTGAGGYADEMEFTITNNEPSVKGYYTVSYFATIATGNVTGVCNQIELQTSTGVAIDVSDDPTTT